MLKKFSFTFIALCMSLSITAAPLVAGTFSDLTTLAEAPKTSVQPVPPPKDSKPLPPPGNCKSCHRPFKRLVAAMHEVKKAGGMTESEFKKAFDALMKIPKDTFKDAKDIDQLAADTLYKAKNITEEQYKKISEFLKSNPPR